MRKSRKLIIILLFQAVWTVDGQPAVTQLLTDGDRVKIERTTKVQRFLLNIYLSQKMYGAATAKYRELMVLLPEDKTLRLEYYKFLARRSRERSPCGEAHDEPIDYGDFLRKIEDTEIRERFSRETDANLKSES